MFLFVTQLWNIDDCGLLGEVRAHNTQINAIATNDQLIFTASKYVCLYGYGVVGNEACFSVGVRRALRPCTSQQAVRRKS